VKLRPTLPVHNLEGVVQDALAAIGYPTYWQGIHTLRRSGARAFYNELCDRMGDNSALEVVSSMLHHANLVITQTYLGIRESRKRRDKVVMDGPMFPSLDATENVIPLRGATSG
jgi:integrase